MKRLIREMASANPLWGAPRILGELYGRLLRGARAHQPNSVRLRRPRPRPSAHPALSVSPGIRRPHGPASNSTRPSPTTRARDSCLRPRHDLRRSVRSGRRRVRVHSGSYAPSSPGRIPTSTRHRVYPPRVSGPCARLQRGAPAAGASRLRPWSATRRSGARTADDSVRGARQFNDFCCF